ncbi:MAG: alpha/beta hydrolase [Candidatus Nanopelagicales bacterium]
MHFTTETSSNGVIERNFSIGEVSGALWSPESGSDRSALVLIGHGGGQHKKAPGILAGARHFVTTCGFNVAAIDAPGHGDRPRTAMDERLIAELRQKQAAGEPIGPIIVDYNAGLAKRAVPEWQTTLDALQELPEIGPHVPVGYWGLSLGTAIGVLLTAVEPRIEAAVFGVLGYDSLTAAAGAVSVPVRFILQWDDEVAERQSCLALFDAFGSKEKTLHANPGGHRDVPAFERDSATRFLVRHLGGLALSSAT